MLRASVVEANDFISIGTRVSGDGPFGLERFSVMGPYSIHRSGSNCPLVVDSDRTDGVCVRIYVYDGRGAPTETATKEDLVIVMGTVASSSRRRCAAAKPIPSREVEEFEEEKLGPAALELRGDRFMASGRRRRQGWSLAISHDFEAAAYSYILAEKCWYCLPSLDLIVVCL